MDSVFAWLVGVGWTVLWLPASSNVFTGRVRRVSVSVMKGGRAMIAPLRSVLTTVMIMGYVIPPTMNVFAIQDGLAKTVLYSNVPMIVFNMEYVRRVNVTVIMVTKV